VKEWEEKDLVYLINEREKVMMIIGEAVRMVKA